MSGATPTRRSLASSFVFLLKPQTVEPREYLLIPPVLGVGFPIELAKTRLHDLTNGPVKALVKKHHHQMRPVCVSRNAFAAQPDMDDTSRQMSPTKPIVLFVSAFIQISII